MTTEDAPPGPQRHIIWERSASAQLKAAQSQEAQATKQATASHGISA